MTTGKARSRRLPIIGRRRFTPDPWRYEGVVYGCDYIDSRLMDSIRITLHMRTEDIGMRIKPPLQIDEQANVELRRQ